VQLDKLGQLGLERKGLLVQQAQLDWGQLGPQEVKAQLEFVEALAQQDLGQLVQAE
jgi:hypothetical protein